MDYFENILKKILEQQGKWVRQSVKIDISKEEKRQIGKHSIPRPELDLVAYVPGENKLEIWEAKSYLDSHGVRFSELNQSYEVPEGRYKFFTCDNYRNIIINRLIVDWVDSHFILPNPIIEIGLAVGNFNSNDEPDIRELFQKQGWNIIGPQEIKLAIKGFEKLGYENDPYVIASKIIFRNN